MRLAELISLSLEEDLGPGCLTTNATVPADARGSAVFLAKQALVLCGHEPAAEVFRQLGATYTPLRPDGSAVTRMAEVARVTGPLRALLTGERLALNFLMRLSGIATHTRDAVSAASGLRVVDTRKTTPLHRALERQAVRMGGAFNHRFALYDGVLIKDNHLRAAGGVTEAIRRARASVHHLVKIEVEVSNLDELREALDAGAEAILLDNMDDALLSEAVRVARAHPNGARALLEASGNMSAERLPRIAGLGLDLVSMGGLVHQARWVDLSMEIIGSDTGLE